MNKRSFRFETRIMEDESNRTRLEIGLDAKSGLYLEFEANHLFFRRVLSPIFQLSTIKLPSIEKDRIGYRDWYANELIRRMRKESTVIDDKPDHMKVDLKQLVERRDALITRIANQMRYFNQHKYKIDDAKYLRETFWKVYPGPRITLTRSGLYIDNLSEYKDLYYGVGIQDEYLHLDPDNISQGSAFMEISKNFIKDFKRYTPAEVNKKLKVVSTKPRSDIRVLRRSEKEATRKYKLPDHWWASLNIFQTLDYFNEKTLFGFSPIAFSIEIPTLFSLVFNIVNKSKPNQVINLKLNTNMKSVSCLGNEYAITNIQLSEGYHRETLQLKSEIFHTILPWIDLIDNIKITVLPYGYPIIIDLKGKIFAKFMNLTNNTKFMRENHYQSLLHQINKLKRSTTENNIDEKDEAEKILNGQLLYLHNFKDTIEIDSEIPIFDDFNNKVFTFLRTFENSIKGEDGVKISLTDLESSIKFQKGKVSTVSCSCGKSSMKFPCLHSRALIIRAFEKGWTNND